MKYIHSLHSKLRLRTLVCLFLLATFCISAVAQPPARRKAEAVSATTKGVRNGSAYRDFPVGQSMPQDVPWRRDIYRTLDLTKDENAMLYFPIVPQDGHKSLFTFIFHLLLKQEIKAYDYTLDGLETFTEKNVVKVRDLMDRYQIFYETNGDKVRVNDVDIPSHQVKLYFIKESEYYDQRTSTFHKRVTALCPVLKRGDDFGGAESQYPMFWIKYEDLAPYLSSLVLMGSNYNNASKLSADDYFTLGLYKGDIYRTTNLQDKILINDAESDPDAVKCEQQRIDREIVDFKDHMFGRDSVAMAKEAAEQAKADSIAAAGGKVKKDKVSKAPTRRSSSSASTVKTDKPKKQKSSRGSSVNKQKSSATRSSNGTLSVRRERR